MIHELVKCVLTSESLIDLATALTHLRANAPAELGPTVTVLRWTIEVRPISVASSHEPLLDPVTANKLATYFEQLQEKFPNVTFTVYVADPDAGLTQLTGVAHWELPR